MINGKDLKAIAQNLGRFAQIRETAKEPQDRVVVQANSETLKVVAGASYGTIIATVHATTQRFLAVISAREFLSVMKTLKAREQYQIVDLNQGWEIGCSLTDAEGNIIANFLRLTKAVPNIPLPPSVTAHTQGGFSITASELDELQIFAGVAGPEKKVDVRGFSDDTISFASCDRSGTFVTKWAVRSFVGNDYSIWGVVFADFLEASRGLGDSRVDFYDDFKIVIENERYRAIGIYDPLGTTLTPIKRPDEWREPSQKAVINRTELIKSVRELAKLDKHECVGLQYVNSVLQVVPVTPEANIFAMGYKLVEILSSIPQKQVGIGLREVAHQPIMIRIPNWIIELAPANPLEKN
jgi:hypothetical protein